MNSRRPPRASLLDSVQATPTASLGAAVSSRRVRRGRGVDEPAAAPAGPRIVEYFGDDADTVALELIKTAPQVTQSFRGGEHLHVSDVIGKCLRKLALMKRMRVSHPVEAIRDGQGITFAIGDALHDYVKARYIAAHPDKVWAEWRCPCGDTREISIYNRRTKPACPSCGMANTVHHEVPLIHPRYPLVGSPDLILWLDDYAAFLPVEIKSINGKGFKELARPMPDHKVQVSWYWELMVENLMPTLDRASVFYVNKEYSFTMPYREYMIDPAPAIILEPYKEDLEAYMIATDNPKAPLPLRVKCGTPSSPDAKSCPVRVTCFGCD